MEIGQRTHIFLSILINRKMHCTEAPAAYLILDDVLIDVVLRSSISLIILVTTLGIQSLLDYSHF